MDLYGSPLGGRRPQMEAAALGFAPRRDVFIFGVHGPVHPFTNGWVASSFGPKQRWSHPRAPSSLPSRTLPGHLDQNLWVGYSWSHT